MSDRDRKRNIVVSWICVGLPGDVWGRCLEERAGNEGNPVFLFAVSGSNTICFAALACCVGNRDFAAVAILFGAVDGNKFCERLIVSSLSVFTAPNLRQIWGRLTLVSVQYYCRVFSCKPDSRSRWWGVGGGGEHGFFILFFLAVFSVLILLRSLASRSFQSFGFCVCARACLCLCPRVFVATPMASTCKQY